jgi:uncharacterized Zn finger protein
MAELASLGSIYWGQTWLDALRSSGLDPEALDAGASYARHDVDLEVFVDKGRVEATAATGRRLTYDVTVTIPTTTDEDWSRVLERVASTSARTAALLDGIAEPALLADARAVGVEFMPGRGELNWECTCSRLQPDTEESHEVEPQTKPCKHVGAVLYLLADSLDDDPFDLLLLRGRSRDEIRTALEELRGGNAHGRDESPDAAWARSRGPIPEVPMPLDEPGALTPWATDPPATAPFTAEGLRVIGADAARRAHHLFTNGPSTTHLDLEPMIDVARRASETEGTPSWRTLVKRSGLSSQELAARAAAWRVAGRAGVQVHVSSDEQRRVSDRAQLRRSLQGSWFRFEKLSGRWTLTKGPAADPNELLRNDDLTPREQS